MQKKVATGTQYLAGNDVLEESVRRLSPKLLDILLFDHSTGKNILWGCDDYCSYGDDFAAEKEILPSQVTGKYAHIIQPRSEKAKDEQLRRTRGKGEVFTPSWICNAQNNLTDEMLFGRKTVFNTEKDKSWERTKGIITFDGAECSWREYIEKDCLEVTCGEAPYICSRYDTVTGKAIKVKDRIGLLDRKLRIVNEHTRHEENWVELAKKAFQSVYAYDFQGDNVLLARENLLFTFWDYYEERFHIPPIPEYLLEFAEIISWNVWQMDGLKFVVPNSCKPVRSDQISLADLGEAPHPCEGCNGGTIFEHSGVYCKIFDWKEQKEIRFVDLMKGDGKNG